eukprot:g3828.t1
MLRSSTAGVELREQSNPMHKGGLPSRPSFLRRKSSALREEYSGRYDMILLFPRPTGGLKVRTGSRLLGTAGYEDFSQDRFVREMLGLRRDPDTGTEFIHSAVRVLKTPRCFLDDRGRQRVGFGGSGRVVEEASRLGMEESQREAMKQALREEYEAGNDGSAEPTTEKRYYELVARAVARRLQLACGLTTEMFLSVDGDEIICTVKADAQDLMTEADRTDYRLQTLNMPFGVPTPTMGERSHNEGIEAGNALLRRRHGAAVDEAERVLRAKCGGPASKPATMDPTLFLNRTHRALQDALGRLGHDEQHASESDAGGVYLAPYAAFKQEAKYRPYYRRYSHAAEEQEDGAGLFRQIDRTRLVGSIVHRHLNLPALEEYGHLAGHFAPHSAPELEWLKAHWALDFSPWTQLQQPLGRIREYFGEKIALYFAWLQFYTRALIVPAIMGLIIQGYNFSSGHSESYSLVVYGVVVTVWSTVFNEFWSRRCSFLNLWWGTTDLHTHETERPSFKGVARISPINDQFEVTHARFRVYYTKIAIGASVVGTMIIAVLTAISMIFYLKTVLVNDPAYGPKKGAQITGVLNGVQIQIMNVVYRTIAIKLNKWENHRTDTEYENNLIAKTFLFQFVNSYASFFFIAFVKIHFESVTAQQQEDRYREFRANFGEPTAAQNHTLNTNPCVINTFDGLPDCLYELQIQLAVIFGIRLVIGNLTEIGIPFIKYKLRVWLEDRRTKEKVQYSKPEQESKLNKYAEMESFDDYAEMILQYGFVTLFVVAFPAAPFLAFTNNLAEVHVDAFKLTSGHRRPWPLSANSIGTWQYFLNVMSSVSVITNCALILFTTNIAELPKSTGAKWLAFMVCEHALLLVKKIIEDFVPDEQHSVQVLSQRHTWLHNMVFRGVVEDDDGDLSERAEELDLTIHPNPIARAKLGAAPVQGGAPAGPRHQVVAQATEAGAAAVPAAGARDPHRSALTVSSFRNRGEDEAMV